MAGESQAPWLKVLTEREKLTWLKKAFMYQTHLSRFALVQNSAMRAGANKCLHCGMCCYSYPCTPRPDELEPIANYLGISIRNLIDKYMVIDTADCKSFFPRWAKHGEEDLTGYRIPPERTFDEGYCILFDIKTKTCLINSVKPSETKLIECWREAETESEGQWGLDAWGPRDIYRFLPEFDPNYSRQPSENLHLPGWSYWYLVVRESPIIW